MGNATYLNMSRLYEMEKEEVLAIQETSQRDIL
jgi:hypothetical protein